uniref:Uncharacterized protein n=2 Tax=Cacopsylla melanoneura TaxID=428564 RepID=A0A8D8TRG9_9HEMI
MEQSSCLLLPTLVLAVLSPALCLPGEKFRINPDDIERVKQMSNLTDNRDRTAKNVNFAWKMTVQSTSPTTQDPKYTSTLDPEMQKKNNEIYDKLFAQLAYTLRDKEYLNRWLTEMDKGYHIFLYEIQKQVNHDKFFKRFYGESIFDPGDEGELQMKLMAAFLSQVGSKEKFVNYVKDLRTNPITGGEEFFIRKPTASEEARNATKAYRILQIHLALGLRTKHTKFMWLDAFDRGFDNLLKEMREKGPRLFFTKVEGDTTMIGPKGGIFWDATIGYIKRLGEKGFSKLVDKINALPMNITGQEMVDQHMIDVSMEDNEFTRHTTVLYSPTWTTQHHDDI